MRVFVTGDQVLALVPLVGSPLHAKFEGPYAGLRQVSDQGKPGAVAGPVGDLYPATLLRHVPYKGCRKCLG